MNDLQDRHELTAIPHLSGSSPNSPTITSPGTPPAHPPPVFSRLIDFFNNIEERGPWQPPLEGWRSLLTRAEAGVDPVDALRTVKSMLHSLTKSNLGHHSISIPTEILRDASRYGK